MKLPGSHSISEETHCCMSQKAASVKSVLLLLGCRIPLASLFPLFCSCPDPVSICNPLQHQFYTWLGHTHSPLHTSETCTDSHKTKLTHNLMNTHSHTHTDRHAPTTQMRKKKTRTNTKAMGNGSV